MTRAELHSPPTPCAGHTPPSPVHLALLVGLAVLIYVAPLGRPGWMATQAGVLPILRVTGAPLPPDTATATDAPLPYILARGFVRTGVEPVRALKLVMGLAIVTGAVGTAALAAHAWGWPSGAMAAALFLAAPAHLAARFIRGAFGEVWFWALVVWAAWALAGAESRWRRAGGVLLAIILLLMWPGATWLVLPALVAIVAADRRRPLPAVWPLWGAVWAAGLGFLVWWQGGTNTGGTATSLHPFQLFSAAWPEPTLAAWVQGDSYQVGAVALMGTLVVLTARWQGRPLQAITGVEVGAGVALAAMGWTLLPWPWATRMTAALGGPPVLVGLAGFLLAVVASHLPRLLPQAATWPWLSLMMALIIWSSFPLLAAPTWPEEFVPDDAPLAAFRVPDRGTAFLLLEVVPDGEPVPGRPLRVTARWQLVRPVAQDYTAFVHLVGPDGSTLAQGDQLLVSEDGRPSSRWGVGEIVAQSFEVQVPEDGPKGPYTLRMGLYLLETLERLPLPDGRDAVEVPL